MLRIAVGSKNPVKINAILAGFKEMLPGIELEAAGYEASSGVTDQPMSDKETITGAKNRAKAALQADTIAAYGVGLEGGMQEFPEGWYDSQWVVIESRSGQIGLGQSIRIPVPKSFIEKIKTGKELGDVIDEAFDQANMKQKQGYIGEVTNGVVTREEMCRGAVISALIPFTNPELFEK
jgi:inosine/xanthosine triphosphatase